MQGTHSPGSVPAACQSCTATFQIDQRDLDFYTKMGVNSPTFCPDCRSRRRLLFRNERTLYRRKCDVTGKDIFSIYAPDAVYKVCDKEYWYSDALDKLAYGQEIQWSIPFFKQFYDFARTIPLPALWVKNSQNSEYNNDMSNSSDCYLCARTHDSERMLYTYRGNHSRDCVDCFQAVKESEFLYDCFEASGCTNSQYLYFSEKCTSSAFLYNCKNCMNCFMCSNLRNKSYCFMNKQLSKSEYDEQMKSIDLGNYEAVQILKKTFSEIVLKTPRKYLTVQNNVACSGDNLLNCKNCTDCYGMKDSENCRYSLDNMLYHDSMDCYSGGRHSELIYESTATSGASNVVGGIRVAFSPNVYYSWFVTNCSNCFGCIGLDKKEYCIFNKQYTKEEYEETLPHLIAHMNAKPYIDAKGRTYRFGEFFPEEFSPFAYNETTAQEYFPLTAREAIEKGYMWREPEEKKYVPTIDSANLKNSITEVDASILKEIISCAHNGECSHQCTKAFRITAAELEFYKRMKVPLPRQCPNCRYYERLTFRNPTKLCQRSCDCAGTVSKNGSYTNEAVHTHGGAACEVTFETSYAPERSEIVYCEGCYQREVV